MGGQTNAILDYQPIIDRCPQIPSSERCSVAFLIPAAWWKALIISDLQELDTSVVALAWGENFFDKNPT